MRSQELLPGVPHVGPSSSPGALIAGSRVRRGAAGVELAPSWVPALQAALREKPRILSALSASSVGAPAGPPWQRRGAAGTCAAACVVSVLAAALERCSLQSGSARPGFRPPPPPGCGRRGEGWVPASGPLRRRGVLSRGGHWGYFCLDFEDGKVLALDRKSVHVIS